ncbi:MAG TPA: hypothetical protein VM659_27310 [Dongiaceae bacterium]|nr:hypothetical protein [Dongiaceae bacterium]
MRPHLVQIRPVRPVRPDPDLYRLLGAKPDGTVVARYRDQDVCDVVIDEQGRRYIFTGLVPRRRDGSYDVSGLKAGEMFIEPGLIYQLIPVQKRFFT